MSPKVPPASLHALDTCTFQLHNWRPFQIHTRTLNSDHTNGFLYKRPCRADRATSFPFDAIDFSKLSLFDDHRPLSVHKRGGLRWRARKRRRIRGSRSGSGRSSDRSGTTRRCCSVGASAANGTCSDFLVTDSSGELFVNGDANWASDVSEAIRNSRREREHGSADKENLSFALQNGNFDSQGFESGYGSEPGYRGDVELGYGDEFDEEEDDQRILFWCHEFGGMDCCHLQEEFDREKPLSLTFSFWRMFTHYSHSQEGEGFTSLIKKNGKVVTLADQKG